MLNRNSCARGRIVLMVIGLLMCSASVYAQDDKMPSKPGEVALGGSPKIDKPQTTVFSGKVVDQNNAPVANVVVQVLAFGCKSGTCPDDLPCSSKCCDCSETPCKCCIDQKAETNAQGIYAVRVRSSAQDYSVRYIMGGEAQGTFAGIKLKPGEDGVAMNVKIEGRSRPNN
jgi:hypothetical protein